MLREGISLWLVPVQGYAECFHLCRSLSDSRLPVCGSFTRGSGRTFVLLRRMAVLFELMSCSCICCQMPTLKLRKDKGGFFTICQCPNQVCAASSWSDILKVIQRAHTEKEGVSYLCVPLTSWDLYVKRGHTPDLMWYQLMGYCLEASCGLPCLVVDPRYTTS